MSMSSSLVKEEKANIGRSKSSTSTLVDEMKLLQELQGQQTGAKRTINSELWHACAGPLVSLPQPGSLVYYFPQGHSEQVTASTRRMSNAHIPSYPGLPSQMMCQVHSVALHADKESDEIYAQMTLQPVNSENDIFPIPDYGLTKSKHPTEFFCKTLTASDTSTHGGFSVPRRAAEKLFPQLDFSMQPPNQELVLRDLHDDSWTFRHIYRGQPKRHLLTTGWSVFVGAKRLKAGDSVLFIRDEKSQLMLGVRRANRQQTALPSSVLSADSMHIGVLAAAAHAASNLSQFTVYYNPRACPSEFVVPLEKYHKATYGIQISVGMRFGMMFETEDSSKRRYMGTIIGISDSDPIRWPNSKWRNLQVEWDEHGCIERPDRVSLWEIETPESLFVYSSSPSSLKRTCLPEFVGWDNMTKRPFSGTPENRCSPMLYPIGGLDSGELLKNMFQSHTINPSFPLTCQQPTYPSIFENLRNHAFQSGKPSSSTIVNKLSHEPLPQSERQNFDYSVLQQHVILKNVTAKTPIQNHQEKQPLTNSHLVSSMSVFQEVASDVRPQSPQKDHLHNVLIDGRDASINRIKKESSQVQDAVEPDKSSVTTRSQPCPDQNPTTILEGCCQSTQEHPLEASIEQLPKLGNIPEYGGDLNCLICPPTQYMDVFGGMLQPSSYPSCLQELNSSSFPSALDSMDTLLLCGADTCSSGDISAVVNLENSTFKRGQAECISGSIVTQCSPKFAQEIGNQMQNGSRSFSGLEAMTPNYLEQFDVEEFSSEIHDVLAQKGSLNSRGPKDFSDESSNLCDGYSSIQFYPSNGHMIAAPSLSCTSQEEFGSTIWDSCFKIPAKGPFCNLSTIQDFQSQITTASITDYALQEFPDTSGGTSSSNIDACDNSLLNNDLRKQVSHLRTYTKVQKQGSVGRSIDVTRFKNYSELRSAIACMFGLDGQLNDPRGSGWKLVYVDYENDVLLVGDDPWDEFTSCAKCIRILSPSEVQQMSHEGAEFINNPSRNHAEPSSIPESS